jgi:hypothetical protein
MPLPRQDSPNQEEVLDEVAARIERSFTDPARVKLLRARGRAAGQPAQGNQGAELRQA